MTKLERLTRRLNLYYDAEQKILNGAEYRIGDRQLRRADLSEVRAVIDDLESQIDLLDNPNGGLRRVTFID